MQCTKQRIILLPVSVKSQTFELKELNSFEAALRLGDKAYWTADDILDQAHQIYQSIFTSEEGWTGQFHKANESAFYAKIGGLKCYNCGGNHTLAQCDKPKNKNRIEANKKKFHENREKVNHNDKK